MSQLLRRRWFKCLPYIHVYVYVYVFISVYACLHVYEYVHASMHVCECECMSMHVHECVVCIFVYVWVCVRVSVECPCMCAYVCVSMHACVYVQVCMCQGVCVCECEGMSLHYVSVKCICACLCMYAWKYVHMWLYIHVCTYVWVCMCVRVCANVSVNASMWKCQCHMSSSIPLHVFLWDSLWMNLEHPIQLGWLATSSGFYLGAGALNWGPHACTVGTLPAKPSPWALFTFKKLSLLPLLSSIHDAPAPHFPSARITGHTLPGLQGAGDGAQNFAWTNEHCTLWSLASSNICNIWALRRSLVWTAGRCEH